MSNEKINFADIDPNNPGDWPLLIKGVALLVICIAVWGAGYYFHTQHQLVALDKVEKEELTLREEFKKKQARAASLDQYREQVEEMKQNLGAMLRQLPNKTEVANLLVDVSQTGLGAGLKFTLFDPHNEVNKDFYAELPIKLTVVGGYHQFGEFVSGLAALPRIVTIHNISIAGGKGKDAALTMNAMAKTYRYYDTDEGK
jgi:type IV pilus assembly protein PilO